MKIVGLNNELEIGCDGNNHFVRFTPILPQVAKPFICCGLCDCKQRDEERRERLKVKSDIVPLEVLIAKLSRRLAALDGGEAFDDNGMPVDGRAIYRAHEEATRKAWAEYNPVTAMGRGQGEG